MKLSWLDRLLIKIALAKSVARGHHNIASTARALSEVFDEINEASRCTSPADEREALK